MRLLQLALPFLMIWSPVSAYASDSAEQIIAEAQSECERFDNGTFSYDAEAAVTEIDATGNGQPDTIVNSSAFDCSTAHSLYCGTGGCAMSVIVDGASHEFLAKAWRVVDTPTGPVLKLEVHWSLCNYQSYCWETFAWTGTSFDSQGARVELPETPTDITEDEWVLVDGSATIQFLKNGTVSGKGPCNRFSGTHETTYPATNIGPLAVTRMACADMEAERDFFLALGSATTITIEGDTLILSSDAGPNLRFQR